MTMARVEPTTAQAPPGSMESSTMVRVLFTRTLPRRMEQSRKLPCLRTGRMAAAYPRSVSVPELITIFSSVLSSDMRPRLRPEKVPESRRQTTMTMTWNQAGTSSLTTRTLTARCWPWCTKSPPGCCCTHM